MEFLRERLKVIVMPMVIHLQAGVVVIRQSIFVAGIARRGRCFAPMIVLRQDFHFDTFVLTVERSAGRHVVSRTLLTLMVPSRRWTSLVVNRVRRGNRRRR